IKNNTASGNGGGFWSSGTLTIRNNSTITANSGGDAGGVSNENGTGILSVDSCSITNNTLTGGGGGGGVGNNGKSASITNSTISGNTGTSNGDSGGIGNFHT